MHQKKIRFIFVFVTMLSLLLPFHSTSLAQGIDKKPFNIVQLGDSYSAGNGARSASNELNFDDPTECYRSPTNWGSQFKESLKDVFYVTYINRACSGGVVVNITEPRNMGDWCVHGVPLPLSGPDEYMDGCTRFQFSRFERSPMSAL